MGFCYLKIYMCEEHSLMCINTAAADQCGVRKYLDLTMGRLFMTFRTLKYIQSSNEQIRNL